MKKIIFYILLLLSLNLHGQSSDDAIPYNRQLNFSVPDIPAFKMLGTDPSDILRPSTPEEFSALLTSVGDISLEISPSMVFRKGDITYSNYRNNYILNSVRISFGNKSSIEGEKDQFGLGIRATLLNKGDIKSDNMTFEMLNDIQSFRDSLKSDFMKKENITIAQLPSRMGDFNQYFRDNFNKELSFQNLESKYWNAQKLDVALGFLGNYEFKKELEDLRFEKLALWATWALPFPKDTNHGQVLFGTSYQPTLKVYDFQFNGNARYYYGIAKNKKNKLKIFAEGQWKYDSIDEEKDWLFNLGLEAGISKGIWLDCIFSNNLTEEDTTIDKSKFRINLRYVN